jgi:hypothetical protein
VKILVLRASVSSSANSERHVPLPQISLRSQSAPYIFRFITYSLFLLCTVTVGYLWNDVNGADVADEGLTAIASREMTAVEYVLSCTSIIEMSKICLMTVFHIIACVMDVHTCWEA